MHYIKYIITFINIVIFVFLLAACGNKENNQKLNENSSKSLNLQKESNIHSKVNSLKLNLIFDNAMNAIEYDKGNYKIEKKKIFIDKKRLFILQIKDRGSIEKQKK